MLKVGQSAPEFILPDQNGDLHRLSDQEGKKVVLYFYPKDDTPGCITEACTIAEVYDEFQKKGIVVFGVSADDEASHKSFAEKYHLPFTLLSDPNSDIIKAYDAYKTDIIAPGIHTRRVTYIIDEAGNIAKAYPEVDPATHAHTILSDLT
jgi:peroxiredoxin Q/BCP